MSLISDLISHLEDNFIGFEKIEHAWTMTPFDKPGENSPALFICPGPENPMPVEHDNCIIQKVDISINLFFIIDHDLLEVTRDKVFSTILGWQYSDAYDPLEFKFGDVKDISGKYIWWNDVFKTGRQIRQEK